MREETMREHDLIEHAMADLDQVIETHVKAVRALRNAQQLKDDSHEDALRLVRGLAVLTGEKLTVEQAVARLRGLIDEQYRVLADSGEEVPE